MTSVELRQLRGAIVEEQRALYDVADKEERDLNSEELEKFEKLEADFDKYSQEIKDAEESEQRRESILARLNDMAGVKIGGEHQGGKEQAVGIESDSYRDAFTAYLRRNAGGEELRALEVGTDSEGGYTVPDHFMKKLIEGLYDANVMRSLCTVIQTTSGTLSIPTVSSQGAADWTDEEGSYNESDDAFGQVTLSAYKMSRIIKVSEELMHDSAFDLESYLATSFGRAFGNLEEAAFVNGNGTLKPTGILSSAGTGKTAAAAAAITTDEILDLYYSLGSVYRSNATWMMKDSTEQLLRKLKDGEGQYLWQPGMQAGKPDKLFGRPVVISSNMPAATTGLDAVCFADFSYYWIADRVGRSFKRLDELYAASGQVGFKGSARTDGKLTLAAAAKVLVMG